MTPRRSLLHASAVALNEDAVLIIGASGAGKSSLALRLMALGATLVGDDRVEVTLADNTLFVSPAPELAGLIEARGVGVLNAEYAKVAKATLIVDLDRTEADRIPQRHSNVVLDVSLPCLHKADFPAFPEAILQYLKAGRAEV